MIDQFIATCIIDMKMKKIDGNEYEPKTIGGCCSNVANFLKENNYSCNIMTSIGSHNSREVLKAKQKAKGNKPNKSSPLTEDNDEKMWCSGALGEECPAQLIHIVWYSNTKYLGNHESHQNGGT